MSHLEQLSIQAWTSNQGGLYWQGWRWEDEIEHNYQT